MKGVIADRRTYIYYRADINVKLRKVIKIYGRLA